MRAKSGSRHTGHAELFGMNPPGDQQAVETDAGRSGDVGAQAVADGEDAPAVVDAEKRQAAIVDRAVGFAVPAHLTALLLVPLRQRSGAQRKTGAVHDDKIGVCAHHRQTARQRSAQQRRVILDRVVPARGAGVQNEFRFLRGIDVVQSEAFADFEIAVRANVQAAPAERRIERIVAPAKILPGLFPRRHDMVVGPGRDPDLGDAADDIVGPPRCVRQQGDPLAGSDQRTQAVDCAGHRRNAVMDDPP